MEETTTLKTFIKELLDSCNDVEFLYLLKSMLEFCIIT